MKKNSLSAQSKAKSAITVLFTLLSIAYVFPVFMVVVNSFKLNTFVKTETFAMPTEKSFAGFANFIKGMTFGGYPFINSE